MTIWVNRSTNWSLKAHLLVGKTKPTGAKQKGRNRMDHVDECGPMCEEDVVNDVV
jgi:hypothetical protein